MKQEIVYQVDHAEPFAAGKQAFSGKILRVDLSEGKIWHEEKGSDFYRLLIGGRGLILHYLLSEMPAGADPLGPENLLIFASGLLTGTILPGTGRHAVGAKSPLTNALASSEAGGWWGHELKRAGFDALVISGASPSPVYLSIENGRAVLRSADHLWGKFTAETEQIIRADLGDDRVRVAQIGPAGENQVRFAAVMHDVNRAAGRSGLGAVMGSKKLKAVAVRGKQRIGLVDRSEMKETLKWITSTYQDSMRWAVDYGTSGSVQYNHDSGGMAVKNYLKGVLEDVSALSGEEFHQALVVERDTCSGCPVRCKIVVESEEPKIDKPYGGPEYESIGALGSLCEVNDPHGVANANQLCAAYGLDTISTGATLAFTMECVEKGLLREGDFLPEFGSTEALVSGIHLIGRREGLGDLMAQGSARMAEEIGGGAEAFLAVARKQELPLHDPRFKNTTGLGYAVSPTGADHMHNMLDNFANFEESDVCNRLEEMGFETPLPLFGISEQKVKAYAHESAVRHVMDAALICHFYPYEYRHLVEAFRAAGGWEDFSADEVNRIGWRIITLARLFVLREGSSHEEDCLSARLYHAVEDGPIAGRTVPGGELAEGLQVYYQFMGWDQRGVPQQDRLEELGIAAYSG